MKLTKEEAISLNRRNIICAVGMYIEPFLAAPNLFPSEYRGILEDFLPYFDKYMSLRVQEADEPWFAAMDVALDMVLSIGDDDATPIAELTWQAARAFLGAMGENNGVV